MEIRRTKWGFKHQELPTPRSGSAGGNAQQEGVGIAVRQRGRKGRREKLKGKRRSGKNRGYLIVDTDIPAGVCPTETYAPANLPLVLLSFPV
jgi:hypothetical protein